MLDAQLLAGHRDIVRILLPLDSERLVSAADDGHMGVWNWKVGGLISNLKGHSRPVTCLLWLAQHQILVSGSSDKTIRIWALEQPSSSTPPLSPSTSSDFSSDAIPPAKPRTPTAAGAGGGAGPATPEGYRCLQTLAAHAGSVTCLVAMGGAHFCSGGNDGVLRIWKIDPQQPLAPCALQADIARQEAEEENLHCLLYLGEEGDALQQQRLVTGSNSNLIMVYDARSCTCEGVLETHRESVLSLCRVSGSAFASGSLDGTIVLWSARTLSPLKIIDHPSDDPKYFRWSVQHILKIGPHHFVTSIGSGFKIFDLDGVCVVEKLDAHASKLNHLCPVYNNLLLATCSSDSSVKIWRPDLVNRRVFLIADIKLHADAVNAITSLDVTTFATCSSDTLMGIFREPLTCSLKRNAIAASNLYHYSARHS